MTGDYNDVGETVTLSAVIKSDSAPTTFTLTEEGTVRTITNTITAVAEADNVSWNIAEQNSFLNFFRTFMDFSQLFPTFLNFSTRS